MQYAQIAGFNFAILRNCDETDKMALVSNLATLINTDEIAGV